MMARNVEQLARAAGQAANDGNWVEAEDLWRQVLKAAPQHPQALLSLGIHALQRGDLSASCMMLKAARAVAPRDLLTLLTLSSACRLSGDVAAEREAIDAALAVDAYYLPALLARASWQERMGDVESASATYGNALGIAPPPSHWPASLRPQLEHARAFVERYSNVLHGYLSQQVRDVLAALPADAAGRWREAVSIVAGRTRPYESRCNQLHVPRLPAIPFYERSEFPWLSQLEAKTDVIRAEFTAAFSGAHDKFNPYIAYRPGDPVNQWQELNHSARWSAYHLWRGGVPVRENLERCPETARALENARMAEIGGLCPNAMFSVLAPKTTIPPHNGETNARVVGHLPLVVPENCLYRVGFEERRWRVGEVLVFDDSIEHEARNDSDQIRVVLIFDLWNPRISEAERGLVQAITTARRAFGGETAARSSAT
jgi:aspartyl/asparaginyl beta-hydroxylase (cupin superfamily)